MRANHNTKLIMSGGETNMLTWYITNFASKKQQWSSNVSALLAKRVAFHTVEERRQMDLSNINKWLIQHCANTLPHDREFSRLEIMSYVMGWGDQFESHHYIGILADVILGALKECFSGLRAQSHVQSQAEINLSAMSDMVETPATSGNNKHLHVITMVSGAITLRDQLHEYMYHRLEMSKMSLFLLCLTHTMQRQGRLMTMAGNSQGLDSLKLRAYGRPPNQRVLYQPGFSKTGQCCVFQIPGHKTLPHFMGGWFPSNNRQGEKELYCASILALLKPWTNLTELKPDIETFEEVFNSFVSTAPRETLDIIEIIQYYYECYDRAKR